MADGQFHRAEALQAQIEATKPSLLKSLLLGRIAWEGGDALRAEQRFDEVLSLSHEVDEESSLRIEALVRLAALLVVENRGDEAREAAMQALNLEPADPMLEVRAWSELARAEGKLRGAASGLR